MRRILLLALFFSGAASASETITYSYDELGRLVTVARSGTVNNGVKACYAYDKADNRSNVAVVISGECASAPSDPPSFSINNPNGLEGGSVIFTVTKTGTTSSSFSVNYATANGTATSTSDYVAASGTLTFAANEASKTVAISTRNNSTVEVTENFFLNLSGATGGATISDAQGIGTIEDDDGGGCPPEGCP